MPKGSHLSNQMSKRALLANEKRAIAAAVQTPFVHLFPFALAIKILASTRVAHAPHEVFKVWV
jgi:hypothetical protein